LTYVTYLNPDESVRLDAAVLGELYLELGEAGAQNVVTRAMEELTQRLTLADQLYREAEFLALRKTVRSTVAVAEQIGMRALANTARAVVECIDAGDPVALAAVLARLMRIGERSLNAVWDLQGLSI
jgi:N-acetylglucosamine kinase-like BadF-type ATPase